MNVPSPSHPTAVRAAEAFIVVFLAALASQVTVGGVPIDLGTDAGRAAALTAILSAVALAVRRALAVQATEPPASDESVG